MGNYSLIRRITEEKELKMSGDLVLSRKEWIARGGVYRGSLGDAAKLGYYTVRVCEKLGQPVTSEEMLLAKDFAEFKTCYADSCLMQDDGTKVRPNLPVFFRITENNN